MFNENELEQFDEKNTTYSPTFRLSAVNAYK